MLIDINISAGVKLIAYAEPAQLHSPWADGETPLSQSTSHVRVLNNQQPAH